MKLLSSLFAAAVILPLQALQIGDFCTVNAPAGAEKILAASLTARGAVQASKGTTVVFTADASLPEEGFRLCVTEENIEIFSSGSAGALYGVYSLLDSSPSLDFPECDLISAPANKWRGAYLNYRFADGKAPGATGNLKKTLYALSRQRINKVFIEFGERLIYNNVKFPNAEASAFSQEQIQEMLAAANELNIEIIPYLQALTHSQWILANPDYSRLMEEPERNDWGTAWCPSNPEMREVFQKVLDDTIEIFKPRYIHFAMDEIPLCSWQKCERCKDRVSEELYRDTIIDYHGMLAKHDVRMIIWHDHFVPLPNRFDKKGVIPAYKILHELPKDIIMNIWQYDEPLEEVEWNIDYFINAGFDVLGAAWHRPDKVQNMAYAYAKAPADASLGFILTYWHYAGDWNIFQISALMAAMTTYTGYYGWDPLADEYDSFPGNPVAATSLYFFENTDIPADWSNAKLSLEKIAAEDISSGNDLTVWGPDKTAWTPDRAVKAEETVKIPVKAKAEALEFVHASSVPVNMKELNGTYARYRSPLCGSYTVIYTDGTKEELALFYRRNIVDRESEWPGLRQETFYRSKNNDKYSAWGSWRWINPSPEKEISEIIIEPAENYTIYCSSIALWNKCIPEE